MSVVLYCFVVETFFASALYSQCLISSHFPFKTVASEQDNFMPLKTICD